jgi:hypothetical protein
MDSVGPGLSRDPDHFLDRQIALKRAQAFLALTPSDLIGFVGFEAMERELVLLCIDGDRVEAEFGRRAEHTNGDFAAIGDQKSRDFGHASSPHRH